MAGPNRRQRPHVFLELSDRGSRPAVGCLAHRLGPCARDPCAPPRPCTPLLHPVVAPRVRTPRVLAPPHTSGSSHPPCPHALCRHCVRL